MLYYIGTARIYLDKCGKPGLERAAECYSLAGCYKHAAEIFESIGKADSAARCFYYLEEYERAGMKLTFVLLILPAVI